MDYTALSSVPGGVHLAGLTHFSLPEILDNGQAFRWTLAPDASYQGIAFGQQITLHQQADQLTILGITLEDFHNHWQEYFDLSTSYSAIKARFDQDPTLSTAMAYAPGLRLLKQEPWESLATFILSQNNHIKRIKGLVERFSQEFGQPIPGGFAFPTPQAIALLSVEDLAPIRAGFRSKYLIDAAQKVDTGAVSLTLSYSLPIEEARAHLMQIHGVGPKVADCVLLFGFHRIESFPVDVWMKRALALFYPNGFPKDLMPWAGIAQQYLFHYTRLNAHLLPKPIKQAKSPKKNPTLPSPTTKRKPQGR